MQRTDPALALMLLAGGALAAPKPCEELKQEIEVKIQANDVPATPWKSCPTTTFRIKAWSSAVATAAPRRSSISATADTAH